MEGLVCSAISSNSLTVPAPGPAGPPLVPGGSSSAAIDSAALALIQRVTACQWPAIPRRVRPGRVRLQIRPMTRNRQRCLFSVLRSPLRKDWVLGSRGRKSQRWLEVHPAVHKPASSTCECRSFSPLRLQRCVAPRWLRPPKSLPSLRPKPKSPGE